MDYNKIATQTYLYIKSGSAESFTKLIDITSYPSPTPIGESVDVSDMSHDIRLYTEGMKDLGGDGMSFGFIYDKTAYDAAKTLDNTSATYQLRFGSTGTYGAWQWTGTHVTAIEGQSVGDVRTGTIRCFPTSDITETTVS